MSKKSEKIFAFGALLQNAAGEELPSSDTLSTTIRLPSLGERVERYMRNPLLQRDLFNDPNYWDDDAVDEFFEEADDGALRPISKHSDAYKDAVEKNKKRLHEEGEARKKKALDDAALEKADFKRRLQEARDEIEAEQKNKSTKKSSPSTDDL